MQKPPIVVVVNCYRNGIGVMRALRQVGIATAALAHNRRAPGYWSRAATRRYLVPDPSRDASGFIAESAAACRELQKTYTVFVLPVNDIYVSTLAAHWERFRDVATPLFEFDPDILRECVDKTAMYAAAQRAGVDYPRTVVDLEQAANLEFDYPVVIKPGNRNTPQHQAAGVFRIRICETADQLQAAIDELQAKRCRYVVQEYIPGGDEQLYTCGLSAYKGKVVASFTARKLRQFPPQTGQCSFGELTDAPAVRDAADRFVDATGFTGIAQVEFKQHGDRYALMEINPRSWSWVSIGLVAGVNLPQALLAAAQGNSVAQEQSAFQGTWTFLAMDLAYHGGRGRVGWVQVLRDALRADAYAHFAWRDPLPALIGWASFISQRLRGRLPEADTGAAP